MDLASHSNIVASLGMYAWIQFERDKAYFRFATRKPDDDDDDGRRHGTSEGGRLKGNEDIFVSNFVYIQSKDSF